MEAKLRIPTALCIASVFEHALHVLTVKSKKCSCRGAPHELLRDEWTRAPASWRHCPREGFLFVTAGGAEEWLATPAADGTGQALNFGAF